MERFAEFLCRDERESGTIETYLRSLRGFAEWAAGWKTTKELLSAWKRGCPAWNTGWSRCTPCGRRAGPRQGPPGTAERDNRRYGHPGQRGAVYHGGGCRDRRGTDRHEGLGWTILLPQKLCRRLLKIRQNEKDRLR